MLVKLGPRGGLSITPPHRPVRPVTKGDAIVMSGSFRWECLHVFLTYPRVPADCPSRDALLEALSVKYNIDWAVVADEQHEDGGRHVHIIIRFQEKLRSRDPNYFDDFLGFHGDYQKARNWRAVLRYVVKDGEYVATGLDVDAILSSAKPGRLATRVATMIREGATIDQVDEAYPGFYLRNKRKCDEYWVYQDLRRTKRAREAWPGRLVAANPLDMAQQAICAWINDAVGNPDLPFGTQQLYIYGVTGMLKTTFVRMLNRYFQIYTIPKTETFYDFYNDGEYDFAFVDEFRSSLPLTWMNEWLGGSHMVLRKKGSQALKKQNIPTIIVSNYAPEDNYPECPDVGREAFFRRLKVVHVVEPLHFTHETRESGEEYEQAQEVVESPSV